MAHNMDNSVMVEVVWNLSIEVNDSKRRFDAGIARVPWQALACLQLKNMQEKNVEVPRSSVPQKDQGTDTILSVLYLELTEPRYSIVDSSDLQFNKAT
ncbi:UNVERIFIED_CONTAM: hypothetical protein K2H54_041590 [Gekko kuhli]